MDPQVCAREGKPSLSFSIEEILKKPSARITRSTETKNRSNYSEKPPALKAGSPLDFGKYKLQHNENVPFFFTSKSVPTDCVEFLFFSFCRNLGFP